MNCRISNQLTIQHVDELKKISIQSFIETFASTNSAENLNSYLENAFTITKLSNELSNPNSFFYFALDGNDVIGYLKLNIQDAQTELINNNALEIERIYVLKDFHGAKVGQLLFAKALEVASQLGVPYVWLGVWEKNEKAINFYQKNGLTVFDKHIFKMGNEEQTDYMMKLDL